MSKSRLPHELLMINMICCLCNNLCCQEGCALISERLLEGWTATINFSRLPCKKLHAELAIRWFAYCCELYFSLPSSLSFLLEKGLKKSLYCLNFTPNIWYFTMKKLIGMEKISLSLFIVAKKGNSHSTWLLMANAHMNHCPIS